MSIKAIFSAGVEALTVPGLHQWDYGRKLEITHPELPAVMEVHFAAVGAREAIVRVVAGVNGVAEVSIPDELLEQPRPVLAWVYLVGDTSGATMLTVTMPIQTRARPTVAGPVPEAITDKYTQAMAAMNEQVNAIRDGLVTAAKALEANHAAEADHATEADHAASATEAGTATSAGSAARADTAGYASSAYESEWATYAEVALEADEAAHADSATTAGTAKSAEAATTAIRTAAGEWMQFSDTDTIKANPENVLQVCVAIGNYDFITTLSYNVAKATRTALGAARVKINAEESYNLTLVLEITAAGKIAVYGHGPDSGGFIQVPASAITGIYYRFI